MAHYYFAYGSNMNPARVTLRKMPFVSAMSAVLPGHRLAFNKRSVKYPGAASANVMPLGPQGTSDTRVEGVVYQLADEHSILMMDPFEGYPILYRRELLPVHTQEGVLLAWTYLANEDHIAEGLRPAEWYLHHLLAGRKFLSEAYYEQLARTECLPDSGEEPV